jgi:multidrug resistance protein, MATE family
LRIAQAIGADRKDSIWPLGKAALVIVSLWMGASSLVVVLGGPTIAAWFSADAAVIAATASLFVAVALMQVADGVQSVSLGALRGLLDSHWPTRVSLACYWGLALPLGCLAALGYGPQGLWIGFGVGLSVAAVTLVARLRLLAR